jgi:hypothetical protein
MTKPQSTAVPEVAWLTAEELGAKIRKCSRTIMNAVYAGQEGVLIPASTKLGGRRVWDPVVVADWIKAQKQKSRKAATTRRQRALKQCKETTK